MWAGPLRGVAATVRSPRLSELQQGMEKGVWLHPSPGHTPLPPGSWSAVNTEDKQLGFLSRGMSFDQNRWLQQLSRTARRLLAFIKRKNKKSVNHSST